ncbi:lipoprotein BA_5634 family protein [Sporosarcina sp. Te-1]|uniref:lipoprotein BA_5634 family protein n=1 Tax=Sporosarcina sp. Te-1 TaxID=2818390 RepID=UPI001A9CE54D|nr:lipoprotein BA_5634 family protein [Sporosarcina sp. Te-1]QTD42776.1 hypothetical protein J3U78_08420 [Sporosarcina sp. Te-1]
MRRRGLGMITTALAVLALSGCSMFAQANGVILYGEEEEITNAVEKEKDKATEEEQHEIKIFTEDNRQIMILTEDTAQSLIKKKLIKEITNQEKATTKAISSLPKVLKGEALLFTKEKSHELELENVNISYEGNLIIGDGRTYADKFLIVNRADWDSFDGTKKTMAILQYDKDPSANGLRYEVEKTQLVRIQD